MLIMNENIGVVLSFILGAYCDFYVTPIVAIVLIIVFVISFSFFPESPTFLIKRNRISVSVQNELLRMANSSLQFNEKNE